MKNSKRNKALYDQNTFTRLAISDDCKFIRELSGDVFAHFGDYSETIPHWFAHPDVMTVLHISNGEPLGFVMLFVLSGEILAIAALPHYQRKGIGTALLRQTEDLAHKLGLHRLSLHTAKENDAARLFFQGAGFKVIRTEGSYYPKGQVAVTMSKVLDHGT